ncbi:MAG TPA: N-acetylmuramoyl-L-alanine amidase [Anaerolineae bacterium]|nr:N-acetylmuramoyl-L-alanine amidase [Anaerolineae bacterium]
MAIPGESDYIYGFHDPGNWRWVLTEKGRAGWVLFTEEIGYDPDAHSAPDYREWSDAGFGVLVRLNNGYAPGGTIPHSRNYDKFARRCANHVGDSKGAHIWIIGNEMNHANEQPNVAFNAGGFTAEELITPDKYAACFKKVRNAIKAVRGHETDQVILGAVAPYTAVVRYSGNEGASWIKYFTDILDVLGNGLDGIALHTYTHGADPNLIFDEKQPWPQFPGLHYHFRAYRDFMKAIPRALRQLPIYLTETDQSDDGQGHILPWADTNSGWVRNAYQEINDWNQTPGNQQIRCLLLYRWGRYDDWYIDGKRGVIEDMRLAAEAGYKWKPKPAEAPLAATPIPPTPGKPTATASDNLNVRTGPGTGFDRIGRMPNGTTYEIVGRNQDSTWLQIPYPNAQGRGWVSAEYANIAGNLETIAVVSTPTTPTPPAPTPPPPAPEPVTPPPGKPTATPKDTLNVRGGPGAQFKRIGGVAARATLDIVGRSADNAWLQIPYPDATGRGWIAAQFVTVAGNLNAVPIAGAPAQPAEEKLVVGDYTLTGAFLKFYQANQPLTGAPISNALTENGVPTQYFESLAVQAAASGVRPLPIGAEVLNARRTIAELRQRPAGSAGYPPQMFGVELREVSATLPTAAGKTWPRRPLSDIAFIVIHHTAAAGTLSPSDLARALVEQQGKPGIKYHFYITADGSVYQTLPLDALTDHAAGQSRTSIGVALAGNFVGQARPSAAQLSGAGALCAWLMAQHGLSPSRMRGMSEIVPTHQSPGEQWIKGENWKERLLAVTEAALDALRGRIPIALTVNVTQPPWDDRTKALPTYNKLPAAQKLQGDRLDYPTRTLDSIRYLVVHHSGTAATTPVEQIADYQVRTQLRNNSGEVTKEQWPGIGYHFYITAEGTIVKCQELTTACYHVARQNAVSVGVCFAGNYTTSATPPNGAQLAAGGQLIAYLMDQLNLDLDAIKGHQDLDNTDCPGQWTTGFAWKPMLLAAVGAKLTLSA